MTASNHAVTGALVASIISEPAVAIPVAFAAHFFMDAIPHFDVDRGKDVNHGSSKKFRMILMSDMFVAALLLVIIPLSLRGYIHWWLVAACMVACMAPDFFWIPRLYNEIKGRAKAHSKDVFTRFHQVIQWRENETQPGIYLEIVWFVAVLIGVYTLAPLT